MKRPIRKPPRLMYKFQCEVSVSTSWMENKQALITVFVSLFPFSALLKPGLIGQSVGILQISASSAANSLKEKIL